ncbi:hypothetical protein BDN72DRAFT_835634 [Pluteus cervinus]|uniref:Uncharacterized protein n=1 Tax=Pluteus cervinus TaxID=181527 RepID=A0ACD3B5R1_9AGAR|nr:hypothetical protein BDN72DRAFT_835634 [Pluteus cervinus]
MRYSSFFAFALSFSLFVVPTVSLDIVTETEPEILATAAFPEDNAFGHVVNGERNRLVLTVENKSDRNVTLVGATGALHHPETEVLVKNLTSLPYGVLLLEGTQLQLPYAFYSEFIPGDLRLTVWLEHSVDGKNYRVSAYDSIVSIVEAPISIFDLKMLSTYLVVAAILGGVGYSVFLTYFPAPKKKKSQAPDTISEPVAASGVGGYQEEWIPEHHLRKTKGGKKQSGVVSGTSADELSAPETSGTEGKRRKGRK